MREKDWPSNWKIIHGDLSEDSFVVDDEESTEWVTVVLQVDSVILGDCVGQVAHDGDAQLAKTTFATGYIGPKRKKSRVIFLISTSLIKC